jgi:hypothetical protein
MLRESLGESRCKLDLQFRAACGLSVRDSHFHLSRQSRDLLRLVLLDRHDQAPCSQEIRSCFGRYKNPRCGEPNTIATSDARRRTAHTISYVQHDRDVA